MAKKEIVVCDNCYTQIPEDVEEARVWIGRGRPRRMDWCQECLAALIDGFERRGTNVDRMEAVEAKRRERLMAEKLQLREEEIAEARAAVSKAIEEWAEGKDPRELLRSAAARLAKGG